MIEMLLCPICDGGAIHDEKGRVYCGDIGCPLHPESNVTIFSIEAWNSLPRFTANDIKAAQIEGAEAMKKILQDGIGLAESMIEHYDYSRNSPAHCKELERTIKRAASVVENLRSGK